MARIVASDAALTDRKQGEEVGRVAAGDTFEVLEITAEHAWGVARPSGLVGYIALSALAAA